MIKDAFYLAAFFFIISLFSLLDISVDENIEFILGIILLLINIYILVYFFSYIYGREKEDKLLYMILTGFLFCLFDIVSMIIFETNLDNLGYQIVAITIFACIVYYYHEYGRKIFERSVKK